MRKLLTATATAALTAAGALIALPAQAVVTQSGGCNDGGGIHYSATVDWNYRYESTSGIRASVSNLDIRRADSEIRADDAGFDIRLRVYSTNTLIQNKVFDGYDPTDQGAYHNVVLNPANPRSNGDVPDVADTYSKVVLTIGTDADGLGDCTIVFRQPAGLPLNPS